MSNKFDLFNILIGNENDNDYKNKPVIIQGITGSFGSTHTKLMQDYGTNIVAGVTPGKGGQVFEDIPVFNTVAEAVQKNPIQISGIFVPAPSVDGALVMIKPHQDINISKEQLISFLRFLGTGTDPYLFHLLGLGRRKPRRHHF